MPVTAKFQADFTSFYDAVRKADAQLIDLSSRAGGAEKALNRMVDNFSGRRIVQDAHLMAEAVERVGGASKLTEAELRTVGAKAQEAADKLRAMGKDVPPGIQNIADKAAQLNKTSSTLIGTLKSVAGAFGIAFSTQQVIRFVDKTLDAASAIKDMSDKLGVGTQAAQEFSYAAEQTGASLETVERAIFEMNKGLATGDKSTVSALKAIGLEFSDIRALQPEDAFKAIAEAIGRVPDPMLQSKLAMELFGKSGEDLLPAIKEGFVQIGQEAPKMADATIKALERAQDAWTKFNRIVTTVSGEVLATMLELPDIVGNVTKDLESFTKFLKEVALLGPGAAIALQHFKKAARGDFDLPNERGKDPRLAPSTADIAAIERARKAQQEFNEALSAFTLEEYAARLRYLETVRAADAKQAEESVRLEFALNKMYLTNAAALGTYAGNVGLFTKQWVGFGQLAPGIVKNITQSGKALGGGFGDFFKKGIKELFGGANSFGEGVSNMLKGIGKGVFNELGSMLTGGLSSLISGGISLIGKGLGKLFGFGDTEKKKVDEMRQAFIDQIGGWHELNKAAQRTGMTLDKVLNARKVKDYEEAVKELQRRIDLQNTAWSKVQAAIEKYGFTIEQLGPALQKQKLTETALELYEDFQLLVAAGIDIDTVLQQMSGKINDFIRLAIKMGFEVDLSLKPILQKMIDLGLLTDENGELITDLEDSGINFSKSVTEAFAEVADSLNEMIDLLKIFLGLADRPPNWDGWVPPPVTVPGGTGPGGDDQQPIPMSASRLASLGRRSDVVHTHVYLNGREIAEAVGSVQDADLRSMKRVA